MKRLIINGDDFGAARGINAAVLRAFREGLLTSASLIACAPWFDDAAAMAAEHGIPVGVHLTATCEWDRYRWRPITPAWSFTESDGTLPRTIDTVRDRADRREVEVEFRAQIERVLATGLHPTHLDSHMGTVYPDLMGALARSYDLPTRNTDAAASDAPTFALTSRASFSSADGDRVERLCRHLRALPDGDHLLVTHPGEDTDELCAMASPSDPVYPWARDFRVADLAMLLDPRVRQVLKECDVRRVSFAEIPARRTSQRVHSPEIATSP